MMKTLTAMAVVLAASISVANAATFPVSGDNDSFVAQIGTGNHSTVNQNGSNNAEATIQIGTQITGLTESFPFIQLNGTPFPLGGNYSTTTQTGASNVANASLTIQAGQSNSAMTTQSGGDRDDSALHNNSISVQDGVGNVSTVTQQAAAEHHRR